MRRSLLWIITLSLPLLFLGLLAYLLKDSVLPINWSDLRASDLINLGALAIGFLGAFVAIGSLFVAVSQLQQATKDGEAQKQSLDTSRRQLQAVVENLKDQQEVLGKNLETSKAVLALQKEQQVVLSKSLETSRALLALQEQQWKREQELASRVPKLQFLLGEQIIVEKERVDVTLTVGQDQKTSLPLSVKNIGLATLRHPLMVAAASNTDVHVRFEGAPLNQTEPFRTQLGGPRVIDILPHKTSNRIFNVTLHLTVPPTVSEFDVLYSATGENLESHAEMTFHVRIERR